MGCFNSTLNKRDNKNDERDNINKTIIKKMLLVDDVEIMSKIMKEYFELSRYNVLINYTTSGKKCIEMCINNNFDYDIVFMDLIMCPMDGYKTAKILLEKKKDIKIIGLTGMVDRESIDKCKNIGMIDVCQKPVNYDLVINKMKNHGLYLEKI